MATQPLAFSRAELTAIVFKAGRGAGLPLGHAEDLGRALGRHGGAAAFDALLRSLKAPWTEIEMHRDGTTLTIAKARAIQALCHVPEALHSGVTRVTLRDLDEPTLIDCYLHGTSVATTREGADWHFALSETASQASGGMPRADQIASLDEYAANTYVPATDASRSGAGQGADQD
ncbi:MAG: DUF3726 domain-containing protein [Rhodobacteraceae bacterium]|nr:DUF3726 domain-containing protein [Paracoccaceae bacterium]